MPKLFICQCFFIILLFSSCAPRVVTTVLKPYPPVLEEHPVTVYELEENAPLDAEIIGFIGVNDPVGSKKTYPYMVELAVEETRKMGGDGYKINTYNKPSFFSSLHQIRGAVLRYSDSDSLMIRNTVDNFTVASFNRIVESSPKSFTETVPYEISVNLGYGRVLTRTKGLTGEERRFENQLNNGLVWELDFNKVYEYGRGFGIFYAGYRSSANYDYVYYRCLLNYVAPMVVGKVDINRWLFKYKAGFGFLAYEQKLTQGNDAGRLTGKTVGANLSLGTDYRLSDSFGIGVEISSIVGSFGSLNAHNLNYSGGQLEDGTRLGVHRINLMVGARYYFGKKKTL